MLFRSETTGTRRRQRRTDFGRMMAVVVDHGDAALGAAHLKAPVHATEFGQGFANLFYWYVEFQGHGYRGSRIERIVRAR